MAVTHTGTEFAEEADEYGREPRTVTGALTTHEVPTLGYTQYFIDGVLVDPASVHKIIEPPTRPVTVKGDTEGHDFHGNQWTGGGSGEGSHNGVDWKPNMSSEEAARWVEGSKYTGTVVHVTDTKNVGAIAAAGFHTGSGEGHGAHYGQGVYLGTDKTTAQFYGVGRGGDTRAVSAKVYTEKPLEVTLGYHDKMVGVQSDVLKAAGLPETETALNPQEMALALQGQGYDSLIITASVSPFQGGGLIGGSQILVFDPKQVVTIGTPETFEGTFNEFGSRVYPGLDTAFAKNKS